MEQLFETLLTTDMLLVAFAVGSVLEIIKQVMVAFKVNKKHTAFKTTMAIAPLALGAMFGHFIVDSGGIAEPWVMGLIGGMLSSKVYDTIAPSLKAYTNGKKPASDETAEATEPADEEPTDPSGGDAA